LEIPGAAESAATGINRTGVIAGYYKDAAGAFSGFVHHTDGTIETFTAHGHDTYATGINDSGTIVGRLVVNSIERGFIRSPHGKITTFDVPGAVYTEPQAVNASGAIAGMLYSDGYAHGFVRSPDGTYTIRPILFMEPTCSASTRTALLWAATIMPIFILTVLFGR
jgi:uncharacterized membrane protein